MCYFLVGENLNSLFVDCFIATLIHKNCLQSLDDMLIDMKDLLKEYKNLLITFEKSETFNMNFYILPNMRLIPSYFEIENIFEIHKSNFSLFTFH